jgi:hypothetical protein
MNMRIRAAAGLLAAAAPGASWAQEYRAPTVPMPAVGVRASRTAAAPHDPAVARTRGPDDDAPAGPGDSVTIDQQKLDRMVEAAVARAMVKYQQASPIPPSPYEPGNGSNPGPSASPQGYAPQAAVPTTYTVQAVPASAVNVLVPPGPVGAFLGHVGTKLAKHGQPRVRSLQLAPATTCATPATTTTTMVPVALMAAVPQAPAAQATPQSIPMPVSKAAPVASPQAAAATAASPQAAPGAPVPFNFSRGR